MEYKKSLAALLVAIILFITGRTLGQQSPLPPKSASEIQHDIGKLRVLGSVLYVAAHPDDENTRLTSWLVGDRGYRTAYLALTRGDGGQNSLGEEVGPHLGILRTQELLGARRIDGAEQMFSRAYDFGYSKNHEETFEIWGKDKILADVVWAIRKFRPDVIITRFAGPEKGGGGHGHHTASAMLAQEAFDLAADPRVFPEQLKYVSTWQPTRLFWNTWQPYRNKDYDFSHTLTVDVDTYSPLLGRGFGEIAAEARSMHKCQDFGSSRWRGELLEYLEHEKGDEAEKDLFEDIDASWSRIGAADIGKKLDEIYQNFNAANPSASVAGLMEVYSMMKGKEGYWFELKREELKKIIVYCSGLWMETTSSEPLVAMGDTISLTANLIKRSALDIEFRGIEYGYPGQHEKLSVSLPNTNTLHTFERKFVLRDVKPGQPYWLVEEMEKGSFNVSNQQMIGLPENPPALEATWNLTIEGVQIDISLPVVHKYVDRSKGELYRPLVFTPPVTVNIPGEVYIFSSNQSQEISLQVKSWLEHAKGKLDIQLPEGWEATPRTIDLDLEGKGSEKIYSITVTPAKKQGFGPLSVVASVGEFRGSYSYRTIQYDHIPPQMVFDPAEARLVRVNLEKRGDLIGYIMGAEDEVAISLEQIGYKVDLLDDDKILADQLSKYDAVIAGNRAYYRRERMPFHQEQILEYVKKGGTYIMQYNKTYEVPRGEQIGPYPIKVSRDRVTNENAEITLLAPDHPVLNFPNKITQADFQDWIQERGLYFPDEWDERYTAILACNDPGESSKEGSLLVTKYGEGYFIYTSLSWFRELPAGVPGAYRLFANMISIGKAGER